MLSSVCCRRCACNSLGLWYAAAKLSAGSPTGSDSVHDYRSAALLSDEYLLDWTILNSTESRSSLTTALGGYSSRVRDRFRPGIRIGFINVACFHHGSQPSGCYPDERLTGEFRASRAVEAIEE